MRLEGEKKSQASRSEISPHVIERNWQFDSHCAAAGNRLGDAWATTGRIPTLKWSKCHSVFRYNDRLTSLAVRATSILQEDGMASDTLMGSSRIARLDRLRGHGGQGAAIHELSL
jgi:hypothetical protein